MTAELAVTVLRDVADRAEHLNVYSLRMISSSESPIEAPAFPYQSYGAAFAGWLRAEADRIEREEADAPA